MGFRQQWFYSVSHWVLWPRDHSLVDEACLVVVSGAWRGWQLSTRRLLTPEAFSVSPPVLCLPSGWQVHAYFNDVILTGGQIISLPLTSMSNGEWFTSFSVKIAL